MAAATCTIEGNIKHESEAAVFQANERTLHDLPEHQAVQAVQAVYRASAKSTTAKAITGWKQAGQPASQPVLLKPISTIMPQAQHATFSSNIVDNSDYACSYARLDLLLLSWCVQELHLR